MCISYFYVTTQDAPTPEVSCTNPENPLFGSCLESILDGCYEPDLSGTCTASEGNIAWSDGSSFSAGENPGFYGPGDDEPCIALEVGMESATLIRGDETLLYTPTEEGIAVGCPDGSTVAASQFQLFEFAVCTGVTCPP
jgi:hypothetical protein